GITDDDSVDSKDGSANPLFYALYRVLEASRGAVGDGNGVIVLDKNDPFWQCLKRDR
ncbi:protease modulator HflC, partial [Xanthomonas sp. LMG 8989]|nr:protease modulator HflC [Xanthomonas sp. LMG 8989]